LIVVTWRVLFQNGSGGGVCFFIKDLH